MPSNPTGRAVYADVPLSNIAISAFQRGGAKPGTYIGAEIFPIVRVEKQGGTYFEIDKGSWLRTPDLSRSPGVAPRGFDFQVSSGNYFCDNKSNRVPMVQEDKANAAMAIQLSNNKAAFGADLLLRANEVEVANAVTSLTNLGSGTTLSGTAQWSDYSNSKPISDVTTGHSFIQNQTGLVANVGIMDFNTYKVVRNHPHIIDRFKFTSGQGGATPQQLAELFDVERILIGQGVKNVAKEGLANSIVPIWGANFVLAHIDPSAVGLETATFGLGMRWPGGGSALDIEVRKYRDADEGTRKDWVETSHYLDHKIVAADLAYGIADTI